MRVRSAGESQLHCQDVQRGLQQGWQRRADDTWRAGAGDEPAPAGAAQHCCTQAELRLGSCADSHLSLKA